MSDVQTETVHPDEQRARDLMAQNEAQAARERELQAAHEPDPNAEPELATVIRFEAGTVYDLLEYLKAWIDWRVAGGKPAEPAVVAEGETREDTLRRLDLPPLATRAQIDEAEANHPAGLLQPEAVERRANAERLGLPLNATQAEIDAAQAVLDQAPTDDDAKAKAEAQREADAKVAATTDSGAVKLGGGAIHYDAGRAHMGGGAIYY